MIYIVIIVCLFLDFILSYFLPSYFNQLNLFYPMLTLTFLIYYYQKKSNNYIKIVIFTGILYDLFFSYICLFNVLMFLAISKILKKVDKLVRYNFFIGLIMLIFSIFLYDLVLFIIVYISEYNMVTFHDLIYKFSHSLLINIAFYLLLSIWNINRFFKK